MAEELETMELVSDAELESYNTIDFDPYDQWGSDDFGDMWD